MNAGAAPAEEDGGEGDCGPGDVCTVKGPWWMLLVIDNSGYSLMVDWDDW